jgi:diphthamide biosynthesis methyltransferase
MNEITIRISLDTEQKLWALYLDDYTAYPNSAADSLQAFIEQRLVTWVDRALAERNQQESDQ